MQIKIIEKKQKQQNQHIKAYNNMPWEMVFIIKNEFTGISYILNTKNVNKIVITNNLQSWRSIYIVIIYGYKF